MSDRIETAPSLLERSLPDAELRYFEQAFPPPIADRLFRELRAQVQWREEEIMLWGKRYLQPRLVAWYGDVDAVYAYSGNRMQPQPWIASLLELRRQVEALAGGSFNSVLLNLYRNERDAVGWHSDDEPELGRNPLIASVSLGAAREFQLRHRRRKELPVEKMALLSGSVLIMSGPTQHHWKHRIKRETRPCGERINLTFRRIFGRPGE